MVIEAVYEELSIKKEVFKILDTVIRKGGIIASNTSYLDINVNQQLCNPDAAPETNTGRLIRSIMMIQLTSI